MEYHSSIYFSDERKMSAGSDRICRPHGVWGGIFIRQSTQQAHGKQGNNLPLPLPPHFYIFFSQKIVKGVKVIT